MFKGGHFWVDAFKHDDLYCHDSDTCSNRDITWLDGTPIDYNSSLFDLYWQNNNTYCAAMVPEIYPKSSSRLHGSNCHNTYEYYSMCSTHCDDQGSFVKCLFYLTSLDLTTFIQFMQFMAFVT